MAAVRPVVGREKMISMNVEIFTRKDRYKKPMNYNFLKSMKRTISSTTVSIKAISLQVFRLKKKQNY